LKWENGLLLHELTRLKNKQECILTCIDRKKLLAPWYMSDFFVPTY